jgi:peptidoglycan/xylan/chitin deacetylase (PgdA/CDA1 family)
MKLRHVARYALCVSLYYSGVLSMARAIRRARRRPRVVILAYHSFSDSVRYLDMAISPSLFMEQLRYLRRSFRTLTVSDFLALGDSVTHAADDIALVTVDDGYADNFGPLVEAARTHGVPATVYLTTGCIDTGEPTTAMWIMLAIHHAAAESIDLPEAGVGPVRIRTPVEKEAAIREIDKALKLLPPGERDALIGRLLERSGSEALIRQRARSAMLEWEQVRLMQGAGIEFGAHSLTHPALSGLGPAAARDEIAGSIRRVREMLGVGAVTFAYPFGGHADVSEAVVRICKESGATAAVMLVDGEMPGGDRFRIPRMMVTSDRSTTPLGAFSRAVWACELEGLVDAVRHFAASVAGHRGVSGR